MTLQEDSDLEEEDKKELNLPRSLSPVQDNQNLSLALEEDNEEEENDNQNLLIARKEANEDTLPTKYPLDSQCSTRPRTKERENSEEEEEISETINPDKEEVTKEAKGKWKRRMGRSKSKRIRTKLKAIIKRSNKLVIKQLGSKRERGNPKGEASKEEPPKPDQI